MKTILSADMKKIPNSTIKRLVKEKSDIKISDSAAQAIAELLEQKARSIARYAVKRAGKSGRKTVMEEDINAYKMKFGD